MIGVLDIIALLAGMGISVGLLIFVQSKSGGNKRLKKTGIVCIYYSFVVILAYLLGKLLDELGLLWNGWVLTCSFVAGVLIFIGFSYAAFRMENEKNYIYRIFGFMGLIGLVLVFLGFELVLVHVFDQCYMKFGVAFCLTGVSFVGITALSCWNTRRKQKRKKADGKSMLSKYN